MEEINIPPPPDDLMFYKWLVGVLAAAFVFAVGYGVKRFVGSVDGLIEEVKSQGKQIVDHDTRIESVEGVVFDVKYHKKKKE